MAFSERLFAEHTQIFANLRQYCADAAQVKRVASVLGLDVRKDEDRQATMRAMLIVLSEVEKNLGDDKNKVITCSFDSFIQAMIDSALYGVPIDGRKLAELVPYGGRVSYQINTAGFVYLVGLHYDGADFKAGIVYEGDTFTVSTKDGYDTYEHVPADPFAQDALKMRGIYVALSYTKEGRPYQNVERLTKADIEKLRGKAKQAGIWNEWFFERAKTAAVKRIAKRQFQTIMGVQAAIEYDNRQNYDMTATALPAPSAGSLIDNLNTKLKPQEQPKALDHSPALPMETAETGVRGEVVENGGNASSSTNKAKETPVCAACNGRGFVEWSDETGNGTMPCECQKR